MTEKYLGLNISAMMLTIITGIFIFIYYVKYYIPLKSSKFILIPVFLAVISIILNGVSIPFKYNNKTMIINSIFMCISVGMAVVTIAD
jgi:hypothetical protein